MYILANLLKETLDMKASDLHLTVGVPPIMRVNGKLKKMLGNNLTKEDTDRFAKEILGDEFDTFKENGEYDSAYSPEGLGRYRVNVFKQKGYSTLALRVITVKIPTLEDLNHPEVIRTLTNKKRGLVLVTGPTGSGKSTTLASMINEINATRADHVVTLEDPIEYLHTHKQSIINQREIGRDTASYSNALRAVLREDPDVILVGEMRDLETISIAITAAETGHLVFSTLHTIGAAKTIDRIIDVFPPYQQQQIRTQLASVIQGVISQQLIPTADGKGRVAALEIMVVTPGIQNIIREGKNHQIESNIQTGSKFGMKTMDMSLAELYRNGVINFDETMNYAVDKTLIRNFL